MVQAADVEAFRPGIGMPLPEELRWVRNMSGAIYPRQHLRAAGRQGWRPCTYERWAPEGRLGDGDNGVGGGSVSRRWGRRLKSAQGSSRCGGPCTVPF